MTTAGPRSTVPLPMLPARVEANHLRERFHNPDEEAGPPPLQDVNGQRPDGLSLADLLAQGGPSLGQLRTAVDEALGSEQPLVSLGWLFDTLEPSLRRPVEVLGLLHLITNMDGFFRDDERQEVYHTVRPDGSRRHLAVPLIAPTSHRGAGMVEPTADRTAGPTGSESA